MTEQTDGTRAAQIVFLSHGAGPLPIPGDPGHKAMVDFMKRLPARLKKPDAILLVSVHWEEPAATLLSAKNPPMLYDYYGFPDKAYSITYPAPRNPEPAERVAGMLRKNSISVRMDNQRGFDHGVFIPLKLMYPEADIPIIQLSLIRGLNPAAYVALGRALRELLNENILVVGSGFSFYNTNVFWEFMQGIRPSQ